MCGYIVYQQECETCMCGYIVYQQECETCMCGYIVYQQNVKLVCVDMSSINRM